MSRQIIETLRPKARSAPLDERVPAVMDRIRALGSGFVEYWFTDLAGRPSRIAQRARLVDERVFSTGIVLDGRSIREPWDQLIVLEPDPEAAYHDPTASVPTLALFCDVGAAMETACEQDSRRVLKRAEARLRREGAASACVVGTEVEFVLETAGAPAAEDAVWEVLRKAAAALNEAGIEADWYRTGPREGQGRVQMRAAPALRTADRVLFYRHVVANVARANGCQARFQPPAALLQHHALWKDGRNLFHDEEGWSMTSRLCRWYAAGLLKHAAALLSFCAPTIESYQSGTLREPVLSRSRAAAACRIPACSLGPVPEARRVMLCLGDPGANPYLAIAAAMQAGLDGMEKAVEPPVDEQGLAARRLPGSLEEAVEGLAEDRGFLAKGGVFSEGLVDSWISRLRGL